MENINVAPSQISTEKKEATENKTTGAADSFLKRFKKTTVALADNARFKTDVYMLGTIGLSAWTVADFISLGPKYYLIGGINALGIGAKLFALFSTKRLKRIKEIIRENKAQNLPAKEAIKRTFKEAYKQES